MVAQGAFRRSKGLTEEGLAKLGYKDTIVFRPGFLAGTHRADSRPLESVFGYVLLPLNEESYLIGIRSAVGLVSRFTNSLAIEVCDVFQCKT